MISASAPISASDRAMEARLAALETKLGLRSSSSSTISAASNSAENNMETRLSTLQRTMEEQTTPEFRSVMKESWQLLDDLDPGAGLTHQQQPLLYKRQEVLASADTLQRDLNELSHIWHLLLTSSSSSNSSSNNGTTISQDAVTQAPILTQIRISDEDQRRLDALRVTLEDLNGRTRVMTLRLNQLLEAHYAVLSAASEKCILADEVLSSRGK